ncbi:MAG: alpha/beta hydrolase [Cyanobacteria bacterium P01_F01_bin.150]
MTAPSAQAAERLFFFFGPFQLSVYIDSLEKFAEDGHIEKDLALYLNRVDEDDREEFRKILLQPVDVNALELSRVLNTPIGEMVLTQLGNVVTLPSGGNGQYALRAAITEAAFDDEGLTVLNLLQSFPTDIRINPSWIFSIAKSLERVINKTDIMIQQVEQLSLSAIDSQHRIDFSKQPDLRQMGPLPVDQKIWTLIDQNRKFPVGSGRDRQFRVLIYQPDDLFTTNREGKIPVVVMSHGLASNPEDRSNLATHLASYGFVVALPQHPGSDTQYVTDLLAGLNRTVFSVNEFIDRPLDISYVIDELEHRNRSEFGDRLDLENVGLLGHSFGGYTVLALAGASIDPEHLRNDCDRQGYLNVSLLLQCRALVLPSIPETLRDDRVTAIVAVNPVNNSIFGPEGLGKIEIPVAFVAGSLDPAAPAIFEQLLSFPWIEAPDKYLMLSEGQAHVDFSQLDAGIFQTLNSLSDLTLPNPDLLHGYGNALSLAFFETFIGGQEDYHMYLDPAYTQYLSQEPFDIYLLRADQEAALVRSLEDVGLN